MNDPKPVPRRRRYLRYGIPLFLLILVGLGVSLPALLSTPPGRRAIVSRLNRSFAPGRLSIDGIRLSWTRGIELSGVVLYEPSGSPVLTSSEASIDRSLWRLITRPNDFGTLRLNHSSLVLGRTAEGKLNLAQALGNLLDHPDPRRDLTVRIVGKVEVRDAGIAQPFTAEQGDLAIHFQPRPAPLLWSVKLREPVVGGSGAIDVTGELDRWRNAPGSTPTPNLNASIKIQDWPASGMVRDLSVAGRVDLNGVLKREAGRWASDGDGRLVGLLLTRSGEGRSPPTDLDLAWKSSFEGQDVRLVGTLGAPRIGRTEGPFAASFDGSFRPSSDRVGIASIALTSPWAKLDLSGEIEDLAGARLANLHGTFAPDYKFVSDHLAKTVEPNAKVLGKPSPWLLKGPLAGLGDGTRPRDLEVSGGLSLTGVDIYGMKLGPADLRAKLNRGLVTFDPVDATLNGGRLVLRPLIDLDAPGGPVIRLGSDSLLENAEINDEVSRRVLSYVAPVLDRATQVNGRVSASIVSAEFPVVRSPQKKLNVVGAVEFRDVVFSPGPLSRDLLSLVGKQPTEGLVLNKPVSLTIADGRIEQQGLSLPIGKVASLELEGWVDFDRNLELMATVPLSSELFPNAPVLNGVAQATRIRVPIGGTLDQPKLDTEAFKQNLSKMGRDVLTRTAVEGVIQLFSRLARPRDPNAPPPPPRMTPEERKALRLEKRALRQEKKNRENLD